MNLKSLDRYQNFLRGMVNLSESDQLLRDELLTNLENISVLSVDKNFDPIHLSPHELADLPPELMTQLALTDSDTYELELIRLIDSVGGIISLDKLIVLLYRRRGEIADRTQLNARLNRMMRKGVIFALPKKKGIYSTKSQENV